MFVIENQEVFSLHGLYVYFGPQCQKMTLLFNHYEDVRSRSYNVKLSFVSLLYVIYMYSLYKVTILLYLLYCNESALYNINVNVF